MSFATDHPDRFDRAFAVWQAFGPERGQPVETRWREQVPDLDERDYAAVARECRAMEDRAFAIARQFLAGEILQADVFVLLAQAYPSLTAERVSRTGSQAIYFAWK